MNKKILAVIFVGVAVAALVALMWWWFFHRPSNVPTQTGSFGSAQNKNGSSGSGGNDNNGSSPTLGSTSAAGKITSGTYLLRTFDGQAVGSYQVSTNPDGSFTFMPINGSNPLSGGTYVLTLNGVTVGNYVLAPVGTNGPTTLYTFNLIPYKTSTTIDNSHIPGTSVGGYGTSTGTGGGVGGGTYAGGTGSGVATVGYGSGTTGGGGVWLSAPPTDNTPVVTGGGGTNTGGGGTNTGGGGGTNTNGGGTNTTGGGGGTTNTGGGTVITGGTTGGSTNTTSGGTTPGSTGIGGGLTFDTTAGTIFSSDTLVNGVAPTIGSTDKPNGAGGTGLGGAALGMIATDVAACAIPALLKSIPGSFAVAITARSMQATGAAASAAAVAVPGGYPTKAVATDMGVAGNAVVTAGGAIAGAADTIANNLGLSINISRIITDDVMNCFAREVAHAMLEQITRSTVAWINSGFNGSPSFVTNYNQFFTNVADRAAGLYLQGSALAFLCSPFSLQVKIAVAQSYAQNGGQQCTLTKAVSNINNFLNGDFSAGGWPGMLSSAVQPTNNPYGAFAYGSVGIHLAASNAMSENKFDMSLSGGFLSIKQMSNCQDIAANPETGNMEVTPGKGQGIQTITSKDASGNVTTQDQLCDQKNVTPGTAIAQQLHETLGIDTQSLEMAKYFDEIITALVSRLMQNIQTKGLYNLGTAGYVTTNNVDTGSMVQQSILQNVNTLTQDAQQVQTYSSQNISAINSTIAAANTLQSCWAALANNPNTSAADKTQALQNAAGIQAIISDLNNRVIGYQSVINQANSGTTALQNTQTQAQSTTDTAQLENIMTSLANQIQNQAFSTSGSVTNAQEDQINLGTILDQNNQVISTEQQACSAGSTTFTLPPTINTTTAPTGLPTTTN